MPRDQSPALPAAVSLDATPWPCGTIGFEDLPAAWASIVNLDDLGLGLDAIGFAGTLPVRDTVHALYVESGGGDPTNRAANDALAKQVATDFIGWRLLGFDRVYNGVVAPPPDGFLDEITIDYSEVNGISTRLATAPWSGNLPETLSHCDAANDCDARPVVYSAKPAATSIAGASLTLNKIKLDVHDGVLRWFKDGSDTIAICPAN